MPSGPRNFNAAPSGFDNKSEHSQQNMMSKFPPSNSGSNNGMPAPASGQASHEYNPQQQQQQQQQQGGAAGSNGSQYNMGYWPNPNSGGQQQNSGQVPFPHQQNPSHLPSLYGNVSQSPNYGYPPRPTSSNPMPRSGSPHADSNNAPLPPPQQMHEGYNGQPQPAANQSGGYPMYVPQYGGAQQAGQGQAIYGGPSGGAYGGGYPQPYGGAAGAAGGAGGPNNGQYGGMYSNQMPHSREGSQDTAQWQRSPYGPAPTYNGAYNGQYAPSSMPSQQQSAYAPGRAGRGASNTGERPFKCDQCPQSFQRSHDLKRHKRIHLAIKPFPCPSCDKSFSRKDALKRHILVKGCGNTSS
ncbi:protein of unknown function [Taphrina deformans PYCC 5710]|uniref:C2H2-type domain-containing protein n=1 Tax=Taphrina deformans (strain PYCC 5710 / ATCC 11124 / CBS 356.35 / IMI 108563 / JCM 9778 / NBRC 8474) TaxID=1097556 RepID=R4XEQ0_TAPDE|nr:protein of unknown function [Taphrina deformans PYCC 5710]|eukprot:CCG84327.1 protein of unknown function [Taphrina deformans PYCC 5710]